MHCPNCPGSSWGDANATQYKPNGATQQYDGAARRNSASLFSVSAPSHLSPCTCSGGHPELVLVDPERPLHRPRLHRVAQLPFQVLPGRQLLLEPRRPAQTDHRVSTHSVLVQYYPGSGQLPLTCKVWRVFPPRCERCGSTSVLLGLASEARMQRSCRVPDFILDTFCAKQLSPTSVGVCCRITIYDFELDVKKGGQCNDFLQVSSAPEVALVPHFLSCGDAAQTVQFLSSQAGRT